nr:unnamed protein product [Spirometra erinaceieuropaei]
MRRDDGLEISDSTNKAEHFSQFFLSVFTREADFTPSNSENMRDPTIENIVFREEAILEELNSLKECKSPGPDEIPAKLVFELAQQLVKPLSFLCQKSFDAGILPTDWKMAHITPLYKSGSRALATNYRPVSLTSICCKVMEKTIKRKLMAYLETHNLLSNAQYGFRRGRSCVTNLLYTMQSWTRALDAKHTVHVAYIDFRKAFDSVPHQRLLHKLRIMGIGGKLLKWIENFLVGRSQIVCVEQQQSRRLHLHPCTNSLVDRHFDHTPDMPSPPTSTIAKFPVSTTNPATEVTASSGPITAAAAAAAAPFVVLYPPDSPAETHENPSTSARPITSIVQLGAVMSTAKSPVAWRQNGETRKLNQTPTKR